MKGVDCSQAFSGGKRAAGASAPFLRKLDAASVAALFTIKRNLRSHVGGALGNRAADAASVMPLSHYRDRSDKQNEPHRVKCQPH